MGVDGGRCRDLAGRTRSNLARYVWPSSLRTALPRTTPSMLPIPTGSGSWKEGPFFGELRPFPLYLADWDSGSKCSLRTSILRK